MLFTFSFKFTTASVKGIGESNNLFLQKSTLALIFKLRVCM